LDWINNASAVEKDFHYADSSILIRGEWILIIKTERIVTPSLTLKPVIHKISTP